MENKIHAKGVIYLIQHKTMPELMYVGQTIETLGKRWNTHMTSFKQYDRMYYRMCFFANYYGTDNFSIMMLKMINNVSQQALDEEERNFIYELGTLNTRDANEEITIKITDGMRNELINRLICNNTALDNIYKLIEKFKYNYKGEELGFIIDENNARLLDDMERSRHQNELDEMLRGCKIKEGAKTGKTVKTAKTAKKDPLTPSAIDLTKPAYERHLDRVNTAYRNSKQIEVKDDTGATKLTTEAREQKREFYHTRNKHELSRKRILREYHNSSRKLTQNTIKKYNFTANELNKQMPMQEDAGKDEEDEEDEEVDDVEDQNEVLESAYEKQRRYAKDHYDKMQETQIKYTYANGEEKDTTLAKVMKLEQWKKRMATADTKLNDTMKRYIRKYNNHFTQEDKEKIQETTLNKYGLTKFDENKIIKDKL